MERIDEDGCRIVESVLDLPVVGTVSYDLGIGIAVDPLNHEANQIVSEAMKRAGRRGDVL